MRFFRPSTEELLYPHGNFFVVHLVQEGRFPSH